MKMVALSPYATARLKNPREMQSESVILDKKPILKNFKFN